MSLSLKYHPDEVLRTICIDCNLALPDRIALGREMLQVMREHKGYGLSASQIGSDQRIFVMHNSIFINPVITDQSSYDIEELEGCLSVPGQQVKILRSSAVDLEFSTTVPENFRLNKHFTGADARCIQHEIDHLNGILIFDHIKSKVSKRLFLDKSLKNRKKYVNLD
jgi:peptide deformylase